MAITIPLTIAEDAPKSELGVFRKLKSELDDSYTIFHSYEMLARTPSGKLGDNEIDFLIFHPVYGLLILEVKGGTIRFDGSLGQWYQYDRAIACPYEQAKKNKYHLLAYLQKSLGKSYVPVYLGHGVCFPDVFGSIPCHPEDMDGTITLTGQDLPHLDQAVTAVMAAHSPEGNHKHTKETAKAIRQALAPKFEMGASVIDQIGLTERQIFHLTEEQCRLMDFLGDRKRVLIEGCAGSGKTVMAVKKVRQLAAEGKKVLFLVFNRLLSEHLTQLFTPQPKNLELGTYHDFCLQKIQEADPGFQIPSQANYQFWKEEIPNRFAEIVRKTSLQYDAIIIDEGQDFHFDYWCTVEDILADDGYFYIFYDPRQNLFATEMEFPIKDTPFILRQNCRNTKAIFSSFKAVLDSSVQQMVDAPEGQPVIEQEAHTPSDMRKLLAALLHDLMHNHGINRQQIVILGGHSLDHTSLAGHPKVGNYLIGSGQETNGIAYYTYMAFKGCESDVIILLDVNEKDSRWNNQLALYTAKSRAKHLLYVLKIHNNVDMTC